MQYKYRNYGIENLMMYITITMLAVYLAQTLLDIPVVGFIFFDRGLILQGEVWRVITFVFQPLNSNPIWLFISLYVYYFLGTSLEREWGTFSFNIYYFIGILGAIIAGFLVGTATNLFINTALLLAFAQLFPDTEFRLFFLIPVKVKYIGYATWIIYGISLIVALVSLDFPMVAAILASLANFFVFFGGDISGKLRTWLKYRGRRRQFKKDKRRYPNQW